MYPINDKLLFNIARVESNHNDKAVSKKGALGRHQIRYSVWHKELKEQGIIKSRNDLFNREKNEKAARYILTKYWTQTRDLDKTLTKYSGGAKNLYLCSSRKEHNKEKSSVFKLVKDLLDLEIITFSQGEYIMNKENKKCVSGGNNG